MLPDNADIDDKSGVNDNSSPEEIFDEMSLETNDKRTTKGDISLRRNPIDNRYL